jgi:Tfp pilus assembly protein PilF
MANKIGAQGNIIEAVHLLETGCMQLEGSSLLQILETLSIFYLNQNNPKIAEIFLSRIVETDPKRYSSWLHLSYANLLISQSDDAKNAYAMAEKYRPLELSQNEYQLLSFLSQHINND